MFRQNQGIIKQEPGPRSTGAAGKECGGWWARLGSNQRPAGYDPAALPLSYGPSWVAYARDLGHVKEHRAGASGHRARSATRRLRIPGLRRGSEVGLQSQQFPLGGPPNRARPFCPLPAPPVARRKLRASAVPRQQAPRGPLRRRALRGRPPPGPQFPAGHRHRQPLAALLPQLRPAAAPLPGPLIRGFPYKA